MTILVVDIGTSSVRGALVEPGGQIVASQRAELHPVSPADGLVEIDAAALARSCVGLARDLADAADAVAGVAITNQRASTVVWDADTGRPLAPALGWQDLRTVGRCLELRAQGIRLAPNQTATKAEWLLDATDGTGTERVVGTIDTFVAWHLSGGSVLVTDRTNASVTGLTDADVGTWDRRVVDALGLGRARLGEIVATVAREPVGTATALPGAPPIVALVGDQQASLAGQGCIRPADAKITFGTGAMLDLVVGSEQPPIAPRGAAGCFPIVGRAIGDEVTWAVEAAMLAAGTNVTWLRENLGLIASDADADEVASTCRDTGGVMFVPAPLGLGTPYWDFGARAMFVGLTRGTGRAELVRAVLEGVAHRGADLVEAAETDAGIEIDVVRVDGGMSRNATFVQALADALRRPVHVSAQIEATTVGAAFLGALGAGLVPDLAAATATVEPGRVVEPAGPDHRDRWRAAVERARGWLPELSAVEF